MRPFKARIFTFFTFALSLTLSLMGSLKTSFADPVNVPIPRLSAQEAEVLRVLKVEIAEKEAKVADTRLPLQQRYRNFYELIQYLGAKTENSGPLSRCTAFSKLMGNLLVLRSGNPRGFLSDAVLFLGDTPTIFGKMTDGARKLAFIQGSSVELRSARLGRSIGGMFSRIMAGAVGGIPADLETIATISKGGDRITPPVALDAVKRIALSKKLGWPVGDWPDWLANHAGMLRKDRVKMVDNAKQNGKGETEAESWGKQELSNGYRQDEGDTDGTGRHDHLIGNMILAFEARDHVLNQNYAVKSVSMGESGVCERVADKVLQYDAFNDQVLYGMIPPVATVADEMNPLDQNGSSTDIKVNQAGYKIGTQLAQDWFDHPPSSKSRVSGESMSRAVYNAVCDESKMPEWPKGPLRGSLFLGQ